jgi:hypothetical protein
LAWSVISGTRLIHQTPCRLAVEGAVSHRDRFLLTFGTELIDHFCHLLGQGCPVAGVPIEHLQSQRDPTGRGRQRQLPLFEIGAMVARIAIRDANQRFIRLFLIRLGFIRAFDGERSAVHMHHLCGQGKALPCLMSHPRKQRRQIMGGKPIQGTPQAIVIQVLGGHPWTN